jgi:hypothetical protein
MKSRTTQVTGEKTERTSWFDFRYAYIETGWFNHDRVKTLNAMRKFYEQVTLDELEKLEEKSIVVFAPSQSILGEVMPGPVNLTGKIFIYLSPILERKRQRDVTHTVAHEFAHVLLEHYDWRKTKQLTPEEERRIRSHQQHPQEREADKLVAKWGLYCNSRIT